MAPLGLNGQNIATTRLMKPGKEMHALEWACNLEKHLNVKMVEQMLF